MCRLEPPLRCNSNGSRLVALCVDSSSPCRFVAAAIAVGSLGCVRNRHMVADASIKRYWRPWPGRDDSRTKWGCGKTLWAFAHLPITFRGAPISPTPCGGANTGRRQNYPEQTEHVQKTGISEPADEKILSKCLIMPGLQQWLADSS